MRACCLICLVAGGLIAIAATALAQAPGNESAEQNVRQSRQYEQLLCSNAAFRAKRVQQECGPITDPAMHESCLASFQCGAPQQAPHWRQAPPSERIR